MTATVTINIYTETSKGSGSYSLSVSGGTAAFQVFTHGAYSDTYYINETYSTATASKPFTFRTPDATNVFARVLAIPSSYTYIFDHASLSGSYSRTEQNTYNSTGQYTVYVTNYAESGVPGLPYTTFNIYFRYAPDIVLTLDKQSGSGGSSSVTYTPGSSPSSGITPPTRTGYVFDGYYESRNGSGTKYFNADGSRNSSLSASQWPQSPTTIYANWVYAVTLNNEGGSGPTSLRLQPNGSWPTVTPPTRSGYIFVGYFSSQNGAGAQYYDSKGNPKQSSVSSPPSTLYAYWISFSGGSGNSSSPYLISTADNLKTLSSSVALGVNYSGIYFKQTKNIDISGSTWTPIGNSSSNYFAGVYDGQGYKIEGLTINTSSSYQGLFGYVQGSSSSTNAEIKNVILENGYISGGSYTGGIAGYANSYVNISGCKNNIEIRGSSYVGGILGEVNSSGVEIQNCLNTGSITATSNYVGGICGYASSSISVTSCVSAGNISGNNYVGGICGRGYGTITSCITKGNITSTDSTGNYVGGLIGYVGSSSLTVSNCAAEGYIFHSGSSSYVGALIGYAYSSSNKFEACSFKGSSNKTLKIYGGTTAPTMTACWSRCGESKIFSSTPDSTWTTYWAVVPNMNDGLPIQKSLYSVASVASSTLSEIAQALNGFTLSS